jgi:hypothetical protein
MICNETLVFSFPVMSCCVVFYTIARFFFIPVNVPVKKQADTVHDQAGAPVLRILKLNIERYKEKDFKVNKSILFTGNPVFFTFTKLYIPYSAVTLDLPIFIGLTKFSFNTNFKNFRI